MNGFRILVFVAVVVMGAAQVAHSREAVNFNIHQQYISPRAAGMGNAFSAVADSYDAIFYNPAGLATLTEGQIHLFLKAGADPKVTDFISEVGDAADKPVDKEDAIAAVLEKNYGNVYSLRGPSLGGLYARPGWGLAFIPMDLTLDAGINALTGPAINLYAVQDSTLAFGLAKKVPVSGEDELYLGATAKGIYRMNVDKLVTVLDLAVDSDIVDVDMAKEGFTVDLDVGTLYRPKWKGKFWEFAQPSFSLVVRNLLDYGYLTNMHLYSDETGDDPESLGRRVDIGSAFRLPDWWVFTSRVALEFRDIGHEFYSLSKGFHMGAEFNWKVRRWFQGGWRVGMSQGFGGEYFTAGFSGRIAAFQMDLATYADEFGAGDVKKAARKYMASLSTTW
jgi:hypothetical protein